MTGLASPLPAGGTARLGGATTVEGGQSLSLEAALYGAVTSNPDLVSLRQGSAVTNAPSPEAVEVARQFPIALNPTLWIDYRPITLVPNGTFGDSASVGNSNGATTNRNRGYYNNGGGYLYLSLRQPVELGHQTTHRYNIARAALDQQRWTVVQAEMTTLVQTYRFFQTAAYRREKLRVARSLAEFNDRLVETLKRRLEAGQSQAADVELATVESQAMHQMARAAQQDYVTALTDLRNQLGRPDAAGTVEPLGEFELPSYIPTLEADAMVSMALQSRADIHAAQAQVNATCSTVKLAKADRIPSPVLGPEYEIDEAGVQYVGFVYISALPVLNSGKALVEQRKAEHRRARVAFEQVQQRAATQVRAAVAKWNGATDLMKESAVLTRNLSERVASLERQFEAGTTDLPRILQARQRLIQLENAQLDATWAATQAQGDLLLAMGAPGLIGSLGEGGGTRPGSASAPPLPSTGTSPFR